MEVNIHEAKTHLSRLLRQVASGEEVVICRSGKPVARLVPALDLPMRRFGIDAGAFEVPDNFDAALPSALLDSFER